MFSRPSRLAASFPSRSLAPVARRPVIPALRLRQPVSSSPTITRSFRTSSVRTARYERFDSPYSAPLGSPNAGPGGGGGGAGPNIWQYFKRRLGGDRAVWVYGIGVGGGGLYYVTHLERVPETGRLRFMDVDEAQERELGRQTQLSTLSEYSTAVLPANHPTTRRVRAVATRIIESSGLGRVKSGGEMGAVEGKVPTWGGGTDAMGVGEILMGSGPEGDHAREGKETEWEVYVIDDRKTKNAFVLPGGKIFVFTGILPVSANDDGLATVLGHEVAHQVARHPAERMSSMKVLFALGFLLESLGLDVGITRLLLTFMLQLPNSRKNESEADFIGLRLMSKACFDPTESTKMWERMSESEGGTGLPTDFLSTHPANAKRIKQLEKWMPDALSIRAASPCGETGSHFSSFMSNLNPSSPYRKGIWS
ncbi:mitochondrial metalloendopeptidase OMA1 [Kwoniella heveanensis BCC8398]|uniref:Mitochondrial metalloendopeptidase OMA1 n=1 Tax=Kwoniella heveanensis BCC8398 TaxID=1296120 RepID=A0A1B9GKX5_9TREE|nr:mitochondrial metalloendopeptidase OMA1 [Kwoniella heveanensis BCC8398]